MGYCTALASSKCAHPPKHAYTPALHCTNHSSSSQPRSYGDSSLFNRGEWLWSPANIKGANKDAKIYVGRSTTRHNTFLLVSSSVRSKQLLCFVQGQGQKREQKHTTKPKFDEFLNHSPLLTMVRSDVIERQALCTIRSHGTRLRKQNNPYQSTLTCLFLQLAPQLMWFCTSLSKRPSILRGGRRG